MSGVEAEAEAEAAANLWLPAGATETHDASETMSVGQARRYRLREFQTQLIERMRAARSGAPQVVNQLGVMIAGQRWLLNLQQC